MRFEIRAVQPMGRPDAYLEDAYPAKLKGLLPRIFAVIDVNYFRRLATVILAA